MKWFLMTILFTVSFSAMADRGSVKYKCIEGPIGISSEEQLVDFDRNGYWCVIGSLTVNMNQNIEQVWFKNLTLVTGPIYIVGRKPPADWSIKFSRLSKAGAIYINSNRRLVSVDLGSIAKVGDVEVISNGELSTLQGAIGEAESVEISHNNSLCDEWIDPFADSTMDFVATDNGSYAECE